MSLPAFPDKLPDFVIEEDSVNKKDMLLKKQKVNNENKKKKIENESINENKTTSEVMKNQIPKSQYDEEGNPVLTIPELDDANLSGEIDKYLKSST